MSIRDVQALQYIDSAGIDELLKEAHIQVHQHRVAEAWLWGCTLTWPLAISLLETFHISLPYWIDCSIFLSLIGYLLFNIGFDVGVFQPYYRSVIYALTYLDDPRAVGPLIDSKFMSERINDRKLAALIRLLPLVRPIHADLLSGSREGRLCALLDHTLWTRQPEESGLAIAILKALQEAGGKRAFRKVQHVATIKATTEYQENIRLAAQESLAVMQARLECPSHKTLIRH